jgi:hypothetical protein
MALVEAAVRTRLYVEHLDAWIMEKGGLVNARRKSVHPVVRERQALVDSLARLLGMLGLERRKVAKQRSILEALAADAPKAEP